MNNDLHDFEQFMQRRENAARSYVSGDATPLGGLVTQDLPATFFAPSGSYRQGAATVWAQYEHDAALFDAGSDSHFEILQMAASDGVAYWVGFQHADVRLRGKAEAVPMSLRITEVFRREGDAWKMVHRHADPLPPNPDDTKP